MEAPGSSLTLGGCEWVVVEEVFERAREREIALCLDVLADELLWGSTSVPEALTRLDLIKEKYRAS